MLRKFLITITTLIVMASLFMGVFTPSRSSYLFLVNGVGVLDCNYFYGCRHEIGHKMDQDLGFPSESPEFGHALQMYMLVELKREAPSDLSVFLIMYPGVFAAYPGQGGGSLQNELYATVYTEANGDISLIPESLQPFYSKDQKYLDLYSCLTRPNRFNICDGTNFSYMDENR